MIQYYDSVQNLFSARLARRGVVVPFMRSHHLRRTQPFGHYTNMVQRNS